MIREWLAVRAHRLRMDADDLERTWIEDGLGPIPDDGPSRRTIEMQRRVADLLDVLAGNDVPPRRP